MTNLMRLLPYELVLEIGKYTNSQTKRALLSVDKRTSEIIRTLIKTIRIYPPSVYNSNDVPEDILFRIIHRYPNINKIIFGPLKYQCGSQEFTKKEATYIKTLILFFENKSDLFTSIKKFDFTEIKISEFNDENIIKELNYLFLKALSKLKLNKIRIRLSANQSLISEYELQNFLNNSSYLENFVFDGFKKERKINLSFENQKSLSKVKLFDWMDSASSINSLKKCPLKELVINNSMFSETLSEAFLRDHSWNLKSLELSSYFLRNDDELNSFTKKLPNLEYLNIKLNSITDQGMEYLGKNCSKLKFFYLTHPILTNEGLTRLSNHLGKLEIIEITSAKNLTSDGIIALAKNCKNLKSFQIHFFNKMKLLAFDALIENCSSLKAVCFSNGYVSQKGLYKLARTINLKYVSLFNISNMDIGSIGTFYERFRKIKRFLNFSTLKSMNKLIAS